jgi:hypothetical protein
MTKKARKHPLPPPGQPYLPGKAKTPRRLDGSFVKGIRPNPGRAKGKRNRVTVMLKDAVLKAAQLIGQDGRGKNGLTGYLMMLATKERAVYARLLEKVLPMQLELKDKTDRPMTAAEAVERLKERRLPIPSTLLALAGPSETAVTIAGAFNGEEDYEAELNGELDEDEPNDR